MLMDSHLWIFYSNFFCANAQTIYNKPRRSCSFRLQRKLVDTLINLTFKRKALAQWTENSCIKLQSCNCNRCFGKNCNITKGIWRVQQMDKLSSEFHVVVTETASLPGMTITSQWTSLIIVYKSNWAFMTRHESTSRDSDTNWLGVLRRHSRGIKLSPNLTVEERSRETPSGHSNTNILIDIRQLYRSICWRC